MYEPIFAGASPGHLIEAGIPPKDSTFLEVHATEWNGLESVWLRLGNSFILGKWLKSSQTVTGKSPNTIQRKSAGNLQKQFIAPSLCIVTNATNAVTNATNGE